MKTASVYTIPPHRDFVTALAAGLLDRFSDSPERLAPVLILLPTRRACRTLREAFLQLSDGVPLLLPRMRPIGDVDEDDLAFSVSTDLLSEGAAWLETPPAIPEIKRQLLLAQQILEGQDISAEQAVLLARALAQLLDQVQTEQLSFDRLTDLAPSRFSSHWRHTLNALKIVTEAWPAILAGKGLMDPAAHRNLMLERLRRQWMQTPPEHPIIAAGSTGSIPGDCRSVGNRSGNAGRGGLFYPDWIAISMKTTGRKSGWTKAILNSGWPACYNISASRGKRYRIGRNRQRKQTPDGLSRRLHVSA